MGDRANPIRDRTLVLRVLVPGLESRLREKMEDCTKSAAEKSSSGSNNPAVNVNKSNTNSANNSGDGNALKEQILDLDGVRVQPTSDDDYTVWKFHCDGMEYPSRLVNLPCPVELHKTHDHAMYYKCADVAQMLIVYEDIRALEEDKQASRIAAASTGANVSWTGPPWVGGENSTGVETNNGFPSYYPHGLTPPLKRVVERRFMVREHSPIAPPRAQVCQVEAQLIELMQKISKEGTGGGGGGGSSAANKRNKVPSLASAQAANKVLEEIDEQIMDYEPWMDDHGRSPHGIEFEADDPLCFTHPEVWLDADEIKEIRKQAIEKLEEEEEQQKQEKAKKEAQQSKKKKKKNTKKSQAAAAAAPPPDVSFDDPTPPPPTKKKGIASKKNAVQVDEVTQAAASMLSSDDLIASAMEDDDLFDFDNMDGDDIINFELDAE